MTDQPGYDPAEDPDADPDQLNPRTGAAAGESEHSASTSRTTGDGGDKDYDPDSDPDSDPESLNPRTDDQAHPES